MMLPVEEADTNRRLMLAPPLSRAHATTCYLAATGEEAANSQSLHRNTRSKRCRAATDRGSLHCRPGSRRRQLVLLPLMIAHSLAIRKRHEGEGGKMVRVSPGFGFGWFLSRCDGT
jgi:hypothetical protein